MAERPLRLAVFDCDGTLVDSLGAIAAAMSRAFEINGFAPPEPREVQGIVGLPLLDAIDRLSPEGADLERLRDGYAHAYRELIADPAMHEPLYEGALEALDALEEAGVLLGVATGKGRSGLHGVLERHGIRERFVTLKTSDDGPGKPNPHMLVAAMEEAGTGPAETIMIGDTTFDILMAANAGVAAIGVTWGYHGPSELKAAGAVHLVSAFADVAPAFERLTGGRDAVA
jgi:phosphoglycolate phosphatase